MKSSVYPHIFAVHPAGRRPIPSPGGIIPYKQQIPYYSLPPHLLTLYFL
jgi:hypothetical protein